MDQNLIDQDQCVSTQIQSRRIKRAGKRRTAATEEKHTLMPINKGVSMLLKISLS